MTFPKRPIFISVGVIGSLAILLTKTPPQATVTPTQQHPAAGGLVNTTVNSPLLEKLAAADRWQAIQNFRQWTERFASADATEKQTLTDEGIQLATQRRPAFQKLIQTDPQRALEQTVPRVIRQDLPESIVALLETPVSARGDFNVYGGRPQGDARPTTGLTLRYFETEAKSYVAHVFGSWENKTTAKEVPVSGVAIDRDLAVAASALRELEPGERIPAGTVVKEECPISGEKTITNTATDIVVEPETPAVEIAGELIRLCNGAHVKVLDDRISSAGMMASGGPGGAGFYKDAFPGTSSEAIGNFRALYIRVTYPDQMRAPNTEQEAMKDMDDVQKYFLQNSFGKLTTTTSVTPLIVLPNTKEWYIAKDSEVDGLGLVHSHSRSEARRLGYDSNQFNVTIVRVNGGPRLSGISWGGGDSVWVSWDGMDVINHEAGHSLGRNHANFWNTNGLSAIGDGENAEYGNSFDVMGGGGNFTAHYNILSKRSLGWLPEESLHRPTANGTYRIYAYDQPSMEATKRYGIKLTKDARRTYYLEYHYNYGVEHTDRAALKNSAVLINHWSDKSNCGHLIDTTPGTPGGKTDGGIAVGRTFSDWESDIHFTVLGRNETTPPSLDVSFQQGPFIGNTAPTLALSASASQIAVGGSITFTATATDANGDQLAYHWDFEDGYESVNSPTLTRSFPATNQLTVMCTVSDMKGGTARRHVVVGVGNHGRAVITGQILAEGQPLKDVLLVSDTDKYCYTDSDGNYALSDLAAGSRTVTASLEGYTFTPGFTNPLTVTVAGPNTGNWTAGSLPILSLTAIADAAEGTANGLFAISRTGDTTQDLVVRVLSATGTAVRGTDYNFFPAYVDNGTFREFTIPAGSASMNVSVQPIADTSAEGPETVILQLASIATHVIRNQGVATLTLTDDDTLLPLVTVRATRDRAEEAGETGSYTLVRSGSTAAALAVSVTLSGTATNGTDTPTIPATLTIPAGQTSLLVPVTATDDALTEGTEDLTLTVASAGTYVRDSNQQAAKVTLIDNDMQSVTVTSPDATANENGRDPAVFLLTRSGPTTAPLKLYYGLRGSASHGQDYLALSGETTIPVGEKSTTVIISPYDDAHGEGNESVTLQLTNFDGTYTPTVPFSATITIVDNADVPLITVDSNSSTIGEPNDNGVFTFTIRGSHTTTTEVNYTLSGTATQGIDYAAVSGTITLPTPVNGIATADVTITPMDDAIVENTETIILTITNSPNYIVYNDGRATAMLRDNDAPTVHLTKHRDVPGEPGTNSSFYIGRSDALGTSTTAGDLTVNFTVSGTATPDADYTAIPTSIIIPDTKSGVDIPLAVLDDTLIEGTETVQLTLANSTNYSIGESVATQLITDNEAEPADSAVRSVGFEVTTSTTTEASTVPNGEYRLLNVTLSAAHTAPVTVEVVPSSGSSAFGDLVDYALVDPVTNLPVTRTTVTFPANSNAVQTVKLRIINDGVIEGNETIVLEAVNPVNARLSSSRNKHTLTLEENLAANPAPRLSFILANSEKLENQDSEPHLIAALDQVLPTTVTVNYSISGTATAGSDFTLAPGTLTFAAGETAKALPLTILNDATFELDETVTVTLSNPASPAILGTNPSYTLAILDDDKSTFSVSSVTPTAVEEGGGLTFAFSRTAGPTSQAVTLSYTLSGTAAAGTDYTNVSGSLTIPAGASSGQLFIQTLDDSAPEATETLILTLNAGTTYFLGSETSAQAEIADTDGPPTILILSPTAGPNIVPTGNGLIAEATATRPGLNGETAIPGMWSQVSGPTATLASAATSSTAITMTTDGQYTFRYTATNGGVTGTQDISVIYGGFTGQQIGTTTAAGSFSRSGNTYTITGAGSGLSSSGTADGFYFMGTPVTGDFDIRCQATSIINPGANASCRFGLMVRASNAANAIYGMGLYRASPRFDFNYRNTAGAATAANTGSTTYTLPRWIRLTRVGNTVSAYHGDGTAWTLRGSQSLSLGDSPLVGLAITSAVAATASTATFTDFSLNQGPTVDAGPAVNAAPYQLTGTATDDNFPLPSSLSYAWSQASGPGTTTFANPTALSTAATFTSGGNYQLRLAANDGQITTFDTTSVAAAANSPIENWRTVEFGANATNQAIAGNLADPDHDGVSNLVEYALGTNPNQPTQGVQAIATSTPGFVTLNYQRNLAATDITTTWQAAGELQTWVPLSPTVTVLSTNGNIQQLRVELPMNGDRRFYSLKVVK